MKHNNHHPYYYLSFSDGFLVLWMFLACVTLYLNIQ